MYIHITPPVYKGVKAVERLFQVARFLALAHLRISLRPIQFLKSQLAIAFTMGWLRLVGSLKLQVSFEPCKRDNILQKRPMILRSLLIVATPSMKCLRSGFLRILWRGLLEIELGIS